MDRQRGSHPIHDDRNDGPVHRHNNMQPTLFVHPKRLRSVKPAVDNDVNGRHLLYPIIRHGIPPDRQHRHVHGGYVFRQLTRISNKHDTIQQDNQ